MDAVQRVPNRKAALQVTLEMSHKLSVADEYTMARRDPTREVAWSKREKVVTTLISSTARLMLW